MIYPFRVDKSLQDGIRRRQLTVFAALVVVTVLVSAVGYHSLNKGHVYFRRAESQLESGHLETALANFERALQHGADDPDAGFEAADAALRLGEDQRALAFIEAALERRDPPAAGNVGRAAGLFDEHGLPAQALAIYEQYGRSVELKEPQLLHMAELLRREFQYDRALVLYRDILTRNPNSVRSSLGLAETLGWLGRYDEALKLTGNLLETYPDSPNVRILHARILSWSGNLSEAILHYRHFLGESP